MEKLKEGLKAAHKNGELGECTVDTATIPIDHLNKKNKGDPPRGNCSEPKAACVAHPNPSPIIGYDTVWCGNSKNPYPLKNKAKNKKKTYSKFEVEQMDFCDTCKDIGNMKVYMDLANSYDELGICWYKL